MNDAKELDDPSDIESDDEDSGPDLLDIDGTRGYPFILYSKTDDGETIALPMRKITITGENGPVLDGNVSIQDLSFLSIALTRYLQADYEVLANSTSFTVALSQRTRERLLQEAHELSQLGASIVDHLHKIRFMS